MARFNRLQPINSLKHIVDVQGGAVLNVRVNNDLIKAVDSPVLANVNEVETASIVNAVYLKVECYATTAAALANAYMYIQKNPGGNLNTVNGNAVGSDDNKKHVIHQEMVMLEQKVSGLPRILFKGVIKIPRGYRRFGTNDTLQISLFSPGVNINFCFQCIYKEYR